MTVVGTFSIIIDMVCRTDEAGIDDVNKKWGCKVRTEGHKRGCTKMSLTTKIYAFIIISVVVIIVPLTLLRLNPIATFFIAVIGTLIFYMAWITIKSKRLNDILEEKCDPVLYLKKCTKSHMGYPDYNKAVAYLSLGDSKAAYDLLTTGEMPKKQTQIMKLTYHCALMCCYIEMGDLEKAGLLYDNHIKAMRTGLMIPKIAFSVDLLFLEYQYKLNITPETSRYFLEQLRHLYSANVKVLTKRQKLSVLYTEAELLEAVGDLEAAKPIYQKVVNKGNKLWIAELAGKKLGSSI